MHEQWKDAVNFLGGLLHVGQFPDFNSPAAIWDLLEAGVCLAEIGNQPTGLTYDQFRQEAFRRSANTPDPLAAERLLRSSLLLPGNQETLQALDSTAQTVEKSLAGGDPGALSSRGEAPWRWVSLALMEYRRGQWAKAAGAVPVPPA